MPGVELCTVGWAVLGVELCSLGCARGGVLMYIHTIDTKYIFTQNGERD